MKTKWNGEYLQGLEELPAKDEIAIAGGETLWYWVGYTLFFTGYMFANTNSYQTSGQKLMNAALG